MQIKISKYNTTVSIDKLVLDLYCLKNFGCWYDENKKDLNEYIRMTYDGLKKSQEVKEDGSRIFFNISRMISDHLLLDIVDSEVKNIYYNKELPF